MCQTLSYSTAASSSQPFRLRCRRHRLHSYSLCDFGTAPWRRRMMKGTVAEVAVFADTDLGTRIAFNVPPHITSGALKSKNNRNTTY